jgi:hypothetical protein
MVQADASRQRVEEALQNYIARLGDEARRRVLPGWKSPDLISRQIDKPCKPSKPSVGDSDGIERDVLAYLNQKQRERFSRGENKKSTVSTEKVLGAVAALRSGLEWWKKTEDKIEDLWAVAESAITTTQFKHSSPVGRLAILHNSSVSEAFWSEFKRRMSALLFQHLRKQNHKNARNGARRQVQRPEMLCKKLPVNAEAMSACANSWLKFVEVWGLGGLILPGPRHQRS